MTLVVLLILAALWAVVLVPPLLRARGERSTDSIGDFSYRLGVLGGSPGTRRQVDRGVLRPVGRPGAPALAAPRATSSAAAHRSAKRRREVLSVLAVATMVSLIASVTVGGAALWGLFLVSALASAAYGALFLHYRSDATDRMAKVHYLPRPVPAARSDFGLRRTAGY